MTTVVLTRDDEPRLVTAVAAEATPTTVATAPPAPPAPLVVTVPGPVQVVQVPGGGPTVVNNNTVTAEASVVTPPPPPPPPPPPAPPTPEPTSPPPPEGTCGVTAYTDWFNVPQDSVSFELPVLNNDERVCSNPLYVINADVNKTQGKVHVLGGTTVAYTPLPGWTGHEAFTYTASDGWGNTSTATIYISVIAS